MVHSRWNGDWNKPICRGQGNLSSETIFYKWHWLLRQLSTTHLHIFYTTLLTRSQMPESRICLNTDFAKCDLPALSPTTLISLCNVRNLMSWYARKIRLCRSSDGEHRPTSKAEAIWQSWKPTAPHGELSGVAAKHFLSKWVSPLNFPSGSSSYSSSPSSSSSSPCVKFAWRDSSSSDAPSVPGE